MKEHMHMYSLAASIPDKKPNLGESGKFVPRTVNVTFTHPKYGKTIWSAQDNDMNDSIMQWSSIGPSMYVTSAEEVKEMVKNFCIKHPEAVVNTNHKPWEKPCLKQY